MSFEVTIKLPKRRQILNHPIGLLSCVKGNEDDGHFPSKVVP